MIVDVGIADITGLPNRITNNVQYEMNQNHFTFGETEVISNAMSIPEGPAPTTSTRLPANTSGTR